MLINHWQPEYWIADIGMLSKSDTALYANTEQISLLTENQYQYVYASETINLYHNIYENLLSQIQQFMCPKLSI